MTAPQKVTFFNHFHNGDLHISREFIRKIMQKVYTINPSTIFSYAHTNDPGLLADIPNLGYENLRALGIDQFDNLRYNGNTVYISTWYAQQRHKYMNIHGMTLDCLYAAFNDTCKSCWGFSMEDISSNPSSFIPTIDYSKFQIQNVQNWLAANPQRKIFVSNGHALSGQATNFPMTPIICELAQKHTDKIFILSNLEAGYVLPANVIHSSNIIQKLNGSDLNENSFITTHCEAIVGRASGVFSYAWTQQNMLQRKFKFICFCGAGVVGKPPHKFWTSSLLSDKINYSAEYVVSDSTNSNEVKSIIDTHITS